MTRNGWLYAWHTGGKAKGRIDWASFHHDLQNTGNYATPLDQGTRARRPAAAATSAARSVSTPWAVILLVALMFLLVQTRRRRWR